MRTDMSKVMTECSRAGGSDLQRGRKAYGEELPLRESIRARHADRNSFGENLGALKRYINSQLGRPWNKVFSEMMLHIDSSKTTHRHILEHIDGYIAINCQVVPLNGDGYSRYSNNRTGFISHGQFGGWRAGARSNVYPGELYVCPKSGIIRKAKDLGPKRAKITEHNYRKLADRVYAVKLNGIWFRVETVPLTTETTTTKVEVANPRTTRSRDRYTEVRTTTYRVDGVLTDYPKDVCIGTVFKFSYGHRHGFNDLHTLYGNGNIVGVAKTQLTTRDLRRHNLRND